MGEEGSGQPSGTPPYPTPHLQAGARGSAAMSHAYITAQTFPFAHRAQPIRRPLSWTICPPPSVTDAGANARSPQPVCGVDEARRRPQWCGKIVNKLIQRWR